MRRRAWRLYHRSLDELAALEIYDEGLILSIDGKVFVEAFLEDGEPRGAVTVGFMDLEVPFEDAMEAIAEYVNDCVFLREVRD